jgi:hypothetical protein
LCNILNREKRTWNYNIKDIPNISPYNFIQCAFRWDEAIKGDNFWSNINNKWSMIIDKIHKSGVRGKDLINDEKLNTFLKQFK